VVFEVYLDDFIAKSEHSRMIGAHPFFDVNTARRNSDRLKIFRLRTILNFRLAEVGLEMLKKSHFLGNLFWIVLKTVLWSDVLLLSSRNLLPFIVIKVRSMLLYDNLCAVIKENAARVVRQDVPKTIFTRVVYPLLNPDSLRMCSLSSLYFLTGTVLSLCGRYKSTLTDRLRTTHRSGWIVRSGSF
jgi:hypothetical protein